MAPPGENPEALVACEAITNVSSQHGSSSEEGNASTSPSHSTSEYRPSSGGSGSSDSATPRKPRQKGTLSDKRTSHRLRLQSHRQQQQPQEEDQQQEQQSSPNEADRRPLSEGSQGSTHRHSCECVEHEAQQQIADATFAYLCGFDIKLVKGSTVEILKIS